MPTLHRLATIRDDVIYFIALYQSWIYRVDHRRINEFGQGGEEDEAKGKKKEDKQEEKPAEVVAASGAEKKKATKRK
jgi:Na+-transporting methylmalonyl-CoA/oxaloacetate decarboxylase gamma subunit